VIAALPKEGGCRNCAGVTPVGAVTIGIPSRTRPPAWPNALLTAWKVRPGNPWKIPDDSEKVLMRSLAMRKLVRKDVFPFFQGSHASPIDGWKLAILSR